VRQSNTIVLTGIADGSAISVTGGEYKIDAGAFTALAGTINNGQSCIAANRVYVHRPIYDRFVAALVARVQALKVGSGLEGGMDVGPMIDAKALASALDFVADAVKGGARVLAGGKRHGDKHCHSEYDVEFNDDYVDDCDNKRFCNEHNQ
jgi:acyl-CoA reductase-like NAD-dependent aldehyde dehydrogenase